MDNNRSHDLGLQRYVLGFICLATTSMLTYFYQLKNTNLYAGFGNIYFSPPNIILGIFFLLIITKFMPRRVDRPSDLFLIIYPTFVVLSFILYGSRDNNFSISIFLINLLFVVFPFFVIKIFVQLRGNLSVDLNLRPQTVLIILLAIGGTSIAYGVIEVGASGGLSIEAAYERRLAARETFGAGTLFAYLNLMTMNGFAPFIAFWAGFRANKSLALAALAFCLAFFYLTGVKAPFASTGLAFLLGVGIRKDKLTLFYKAIIAITAALFLLFVLEIWVNGYSYAAEYFFRRIYIMPGFGLHHYLDLTIWHENGLWSPFVGMPSDVSVSHWIGLNYYGNAEINANTNAFIHALASGGYGFYFLILFGVALFFKFIDALFEGSNNPGFLLIGFVYSFLLTEQSALTALVSSGVGLLVALVILTGDQLTPDEHLAARQARSRPLRNS